MSRIFVCGLTNIETTVKVESFPVEYSPCRYPFFGVNSTVSGVGVNVAYALKALGNEIDAATIIGNDFSGKWVRSDFLSRGISDRYIVSIGAETPQSVILYETGGRRQINVDLKAVQETKYPEELFVAGLNECDLAVLCNINFSRPMLEKARAMGKKIATDVHCLSDIYDEYNADFLRYSDIVFLSNEHMSDPYLFVESVFREYGNEIIVVGLGSQGALLHVKESGFSHFPAVSTREIINTIGAGDAIFSAFVHFYVKGESPHLALDKAVCFASYKIGEKGAADGFLSEKDLLALYKDVKSRNS